MSDVNYQIVSTGNPPNSLVLYAVWDSGAAISHDQGVSWTTISPPPERPRMTYIEFEYGDILRGDTVVNEIVRMYTEHGHYELIGDQWRPVTTGSIPPEDLPDDS